MIGSRFNATADAITQEVTDRSNADRELSGKIQVEADKISLVVGTTQSGNYIKAASITAAINGDNSTVVRIKADKVYLEGQSQYLSTALAATLNCATLSASTVYSGPVHATAFYQGTNTNGAFWQSKRFVTSVSYSTNSDGYVTSVDYNRDYIYYLGHT
jgi:hypothetical protein